MDIDSLLVEETCTIIDAMKQLDQSARKVLFVHRKGRLVAAVSDGDVRRWILSGGGLLEPVSKAANYKPKYLFWEDRLSATAFMKEHTLSALPIVDQNYSIKTIEFRDGKGNVTVTGTITLPVVIMAGGKGTRLHPYTKILPKPLIPVNDVTIAEHIIHQFQEIGCREFYMIVNHKKQMIKAYFSEEGGSSLFFNENPKRCSLTFIEETKPLGTGGGLSLLKGKIDKTFILTNCDILIQDSFEHILKFHKEQKNLITMICSLKNFPISYGVVDIGKNGTILGMREKPEVSFFTNTGCYIVEPEVIRELEDERAIGFPDVIEEYRKAGKPVGVYPISEGAWLDMGNMEELQRMEELLGNM